MCVSLRRQHLEMPAEALPSRDGLRVRHLEELQGLAAACGHLAREEQLSQCSLLRRLEAHRLIRFPRLAPSVDKVLAMAVDLEEEAGIADQTVVLGIPLEDATCSGMHGLILEEPVQEPRQWHVVVTDEGCGVHVHDPAALLLPGLGICQSLMQKGNPIPAVGRLLRHSGSLFLGHGQRERIAPLVCVSLVDDGIHCPVSFLVKACPQGLPLQHRNLEDAAGESIACRLRFHAQVKCLRGT
mmetsp:Transcript_34144/g.63722  ORF Transcript_34144/g.63722 Transcript_34144/m.63722 type:complete len:241 (+) Transcript_34144:452-1174(+)